ncbi:MAG TPA: STAS domain-containing protein [Mycobacterium sp.]|nr:STAS domain-containing protein [Mycobacterium sp.]
MSVTSIVELNGQFPSQSWDCHTAHLTARWGRSGAVITVTGELDAANADELAEYVRRCAAHCEWLVLDFSELEFMGTAGFAALHRVNTQCEFHYVHWALVPGAATLRLLRVCDPDAALPSTESVGVALAKVALAKVQDFPHQSVPQPR